MLQKDVQSFARWVAKEEHFLLRGSEFHGYRSRGFTPKGL